ncbi:hypothetical protein ES703_109423 [subsurface metagenome]
MEGHHTIEEQVVLSLSNDLCLAVLGDEDRKLFEVSAGEVPNTFFGTGFEFEAVFKFSVGLIYRDY